MLQINWHNWTNQSSGSAFTWWTRYTCSYSQWRNDCCRSFLLAGPPWESGFSSLSLSFLISKIGTTISSSSRCYEVLIKSWVWTCFVNSKVLWKWKGYCYYQRGSSSINTFQINDYLWNKKTNSSSAQCPDVNEACLLVLNI